MKINVTYDGGESVAYKVKPRHLIQFEDDHGEFTETARSAYTLAHIASGAPEGFKEWLNSVDDIQITGGEQAEGAEGGSQGEPVPTV